MASPPDQELEGDGRQVGTLRHRTQSQGAKSPSVVSASNLAPPASPSLVFPSLDASPPLSSEIIRLNIGGVPYMTTRATLLSRGQNFFGPLLDGQFGSLKDTSGAYFIDRNGRVFAPLLDYLRQGVLVLPSDVKIEILCEEAKFYGIDILPGLCGELKEGLYTSSNWILFFERDPDHPWIFGITGVEEKTKRVFFQESCFVKDGSIIWRDHIISVKHGKLYIWTKSVFKSKTQLYYRASKSERFPQLLMEGLESDRKHPPAIDREAVEGNGQGSNTGLGTNQEGGGTGGGGSRRDADPSNSLSASSLSSSGSFEEVPVLLSFSQSSQGITCRSYFGSPPPDVPKPAPSFISHVTVLCRSLLILSCNDGQWLLYLHSDLAFFSFNHPSLPFSDSFHLLSHK